MSKTLTEMIIEAVHARDAAMADLASAKRRLESADAEIARLVGVENAPQAAPQRSEQKREPSSKGDKLNRVAEMLRERGRIRSSDVAALLGITQEYARNLMVHAVKRQIADRESPGYFVPFGSLPKTQEMPGLELDESKE